MTDVSAFVDAQQIPSGLASAISGSPGYTCLLAMIEAGDARYEGDQFFTDGSRAVTADVLPSGHKPARNPEEMHLIIDPGYFERAEQEYATPWKIVWWREAIQNAVDAKAKNLTLSVQESVDEDLVEVTCIDDGIGMDKDTLQFKFLALGGTTKGQAGQIGGFGVAKKILCFRWPRWKIYTREHYLHSENGKMEYETGEYRSGTMLKVWMPKESGMYTRADMAKEFLGRCNLPGVKATINGTPWGGRWLPNGKHVRNLQGDRADAKVYYTKESKLLQGQCYVRTGEGLFMHDRYLSSEVKGYVIIELVAKQNPKTNQPYPSRDFLAASRDDLTDERLKEAISKMLNEMAVDVKSGLKSKAVAKVQKYTGKGGKFKPEFKALFSNVMYNMETAKAKDGVQLTDDARKKISEMLSSSPAMNVELMVELLRSRYTGETQVETALFHITSGYWRRDFLIYPDPDLDDFRLQKRFKPEYHTATLHKLMRTWADLCMYVMVALNCRKDFGVGFVFSNDASAMYLKRDEENWLLLNPYILGEKIHRQLGIKWDESLKNKPEWVPSDRKHLQVLFALAIHECTHFVDDISYHSESFSSAFTYNTALAGPGFAMLERVAKASRALARSEREAPIPKPEQTQSVQAEIKKIREDMFALVPDSSRFYQTEGPKGDGMFLISGDRNPEPESDLYSGIPVIAVDPANNSAWFVYRHRSKSVTGDIYGDLDAFPFVNSAYWDLRNHYKEYPTLVMAATCEMHNLLKAFAATHDYWPDASFPDTLMPIMTARDALLLQLREEAKAYFKAHPWTVEGFKRSNPYDFKMAYCVLTYLSSPKWSVMDGILIRLDEAIARVPDTTKYVLEEVLADVGHIKEDRRKTSVYSVYAWSTPIPDRRHQSFGSSIILSKMGQAWVIDDDEHIRFVTSSNFSYAAPYSEEIRALSMLDPVMYGTLILGLQKGLKAAYKYAVTAMWFKREGWVDTRTGVSPEDTVRDEMVNEITRQLQRLKETETPNTGKIERLVMEDAMEAGLIK